MKKRLFILITCFLLVFCSSSNICYSTISKSNVNKNKITLSEKNAIKKIKQIDKYATELIPCSKNNTVSSYIDKYSRDYYMFLANYGTGEEKYTSEELYLVNKKTGFIYTLLPLGTPKLKSH